jgi:hypothetical protein
MESIRDRGSGHLAAGVRTDDHKEMGFSSADWQGQEFPQRQALSANGSSRL